MCVFGPLERSAAQQPGIKCNSSLCGRTKKWLFCNAVKGAESSAIVCFNQQRTQPRTFYIFEEEKQ